MSTLPHLRLTVPDHGCISAQKLLKLAEQLDKTVFTHYEPFENWVHESGKVVLVGEAAHPITVSRDSPIVLEYE